MSDILYGRRNVLVATGPAPGLDRDGYYNQRCEALAVIPATSQPPKDVLTRLGIEWPPWATGLQLVADNCGEGVPMRECVQSALNAKKEG